MSDLHYFHCGPIPIYFGVCFSEVAYKKEMRRMNVNDAGDFLHVGRSTCYHFENSDGETTILVCYDPAAGKGKLPSQIAGLVAHEASHAADYAFESMREDEPGGEVRAYLVQWFTQCMLGALEKRKKK